MSGGVGGNVLPEDWAAFAVVGDGPAIPRRGRDLPGEVFERRALAFCVVCHVVSGNSIPNSVDVRLGPLLKNFAASAVLKLSVSPFRSTALTRTSAGVCATGTPSDGNNCR